MSETYLVSEDTQSNLGVHVHRDCHRHRRGNQTHQDIDQKQHSKDNPTRATALIGPNPRYGIVRHFEESLFRLLLLYHQKKKLLFLFLF